MLTKDPMQRVGWMELFQIQIDSQGNIQSGEVQQKIMSLEDAKSSNESISTSSYKSIR